MPLPAEPRWLSFRLLQVIHAQQLERFGGSAGVLDLNVVHSSLARAQNRYAYGDDADLADFAAAYLVGFAGKQGFVDGNKRTGLACALLFLALNDSPLHLPGPDLYALTMEVANHRIGEADVAAWFRGRIERSSR